MVDSRRWTFNPSPDGVGDQGAGRLLAQKARVDMPEPDLSAASAHKDEGGRQFKAGDIAAADAEYHSALDALGGPVELAWPAVESLALLCRSNRAMCLLQARAPPPPPPCCPVAPPPPPTSARLHAAAGS